MWIEASVELPRLWEHLSSRQTHRSLWKHLSFRQTHRSLWKHLSFRPEWRSHEAEKSRGSRAGDLSITSPSVTSVEMTELTWIDASIKMTRFSRNNGASNWPEQRNKKIFVFFPLQLDFLADRDII